MLMKLANLEFHEPMQTLYRELTIRGGSRKTIKSYINHNKDFLRFIKKSPKEVTRNNIKDYLFYLKESRNLSNTSLNHVISALKFYYEEVLKRHFFHDIMRPKKEKPIPTVLTKEEIRAMIETTANPKHKLLVKLMYASGLRVGEAVRLKTEHLNLDEGTILVKMGKGKKDRVTPLSKNLIVEIKDNLSERKDDSTYLFPGAKERSHLSERSAQKIVERAAKFSRIKKNVSCHALRHSFATHLLESGVDIRIIQKLLGHKRITATEIYTQISTQTIKNVKSPLEDL